MYLHTLHTIVMLSIPLPTSLCILFTPYLLFFQVAARSRGLYDVTFVAQEAIPHFVNVTFNEEDVSG